MGRFRAFLKGLFESVVLWSSEPAKQKPEEISQLGHQEDPTLCSLLSPGYDPRQGIDLGIA